LDVCERAEPIDLQFINELIGIEGFGAAGKPHGVEVSGEHKWIIRERYAGF
jgi:hypothetical protein